MSYHALATVTLTAASGFPDDNVVNTFALEASAGDPADDQVGIVAALGNFYSGTLPVAGQSISHYISPAINRSVAPLVRLYEVTDLDGSTPNGSPYYTGNGAVLQAADSPTPLPDEVALVVTLRALGWETAPVEGPDNEDPGLALDRPKQRRSGRIFLGPFNTNASMLVSGKARPPAAFVTKIGEACVRLKSELSALGVDWCVWSRQDADFRNVTDVQIDNAFDTQRRRGPAPTVRTSFDL